MGEAASPVCFELAKRLKKAPRLIAQEIAASLGTVPGIARVEVAGGGYLNAYFDRAAFWGQAIAEGSGEWRVASAEKKKERDKDKGQRRGAEGAESRGEASKEKIIVEHTSINPNKA